MRQKIVALSTYGIVPARYGGPIRLLNLMQRLARWYDVTVIAYDIHCKSPLFCQIAPHFRALCFPVCGPDQSHFFSLLQQSGGIFLHDILCTSDYSFSGDFLSATKKYCEASDIIISEQPYFMPLANMLKRDGQIVVNGSQNFEYDLKTKYYDKVPIELRGKYLREVKLVEALSLSVSDLDICVSEEDKASLSIEYKSPKDSISIIPNCTDCKFMQYVDVKTRGEIKEKAGLSGRGVGVFLGSGYTPNVNALRAISSALSAVRRDFVLIVIGSISDAFSSFEMNAMSNCIFTGYVSEKEKRGILAAADFAIHIILEGSGTNLKTFDYMASGLPLIANTLGARGIPGAQDAFLMVDGPNDLPDAIDSLLNDEDERVERGKASRAIVESYFDWDVAARSLRSLLTDRSAA